MARCGDRRRLAGPDMSAAATELRAYREGIEVVAAQACGLVVDPG